MKEISKHRFIRALLKQPVDKTPVWIMRQAGRYLPEYRELRANVPNFMTFCKNPALACEVTLQPLARFDLDAAIIFSDILTIPDAMGLDLEFVSGQGPVIHNPIRTLDDVKRLHEPDIEQSLGYVMEAIDLTSSKLAGKKPLIGFAGSPWTVACYMVEGSGSKTFYRIKEMLYKNPGALTALLDKLADITVRYLNAQIKAGANAIMLFDTWGGILTPEAYQIFSLAYMRKISEQLLREHEGKRIPLTFFTKNGGQWLETIAASGCDAVGLDWTVDISDAKRRVGEKVALQGNMDPAILFSTPERIKEEVEQILQKYGDLNTGHVFNLGHGIDKSTPIDNVAALVDAVHQVSHERV